MQLCIVLNPEALALLELPVNGNGGHQSLMRRIAKQRVGNLQYLTEAQVVAIRKNANGVGGFQKRWRALVAHFESQLPAPEPQAAEPVCQETESSTKAIHV